MASATGVEILFETTKDQFRNEIDALVCYFHGIITNNGFKCFGIDSMAEFNEESSSLSVMLPAGWNSSDEVYTISYQNEEKVTHLLKVIRMMKVLTVLFMRTTKTNWYKLAAMIVSPEEYATGTNTSFESAYKNTEALNERFKNQILEKLKDTVEKPHIPIKAIEKTGSPEAKRPRTETSPRKSPRKSPSREKSLSKERSPYSYRSSGERSRSHDSFSSGERSASPVSEESHHSPKKPARRSSVPLVTPKPSDAATVPDGCGHKGIMVTALSERSSDENIKLGLFHHFKTFVSNKQKDFRIDIFAKGTNRHAIVSFKKHADAAKALKESQGKRLLGCVIMLEENAGLPMGVDGDEDDEESINEYHTKATKSLFLGKLSEDMTKEDVREVCEMYGKIIDLEMKEMWGKPMYAFVEFDDIGCVVNGIKKLKDKLVKGAEVQVGFGKSQPMNCVWLNCVPSTVKNKDLYVQFNSFGGITHIVMDRILGRALVYYELRESAEKAVTAMRNKIIGGRRIQIDFASRLCQKDFFKKMQDTQQLRDGEEPDDRSVRKRREAAAAAAAAAAAKAQESNPGRSLTRSRSRSLDRVSRRSESYKYHSPSPGRTRRRYYTESPSKSYGNGAQYGAPQTVRTGFPRNYKELSPEDPYRRREYVDDYYGVGGPSQRQKYVAGVICYICGKAGHRPEDCRGEEVCNSCGYAGHNPRYCPSKDTARL